MLRLYGICISNYYNKIKFALREKGIPFEEVNVAPSQDPALLERSPLGKVPMLLTGDGPISESHVIAEYLEDTCPQPPLLPTNPYARAKCRELTQYIELHVELVQRRLYPEAFFGGKVEASVKEEVYPLLKKGVAGLAQLAKFSPYIAGNAFTLADCAAWAHLPILGQVSKIIYGEELLENIPGVRDYLKLISARPHAQAVNADRKTAFLELANR